MRALARRRLRVADDGAQIIYEGDAAAGKPATLDEDPQPSSQSNASSGLKPGSSPGSLRARTSAARAEPPRTATRASRSPRAATRELPADRGGGDRGGDPGNDYRAAVERVKAGDHAAGVAALRAFLARYPRHDFADNAQYWLGEAYYAQHDYAGALVEFRAVADTYPLGNKVPDALLKVGYCYQALGQKTKARAALEQLVTRYPKTEPAATAAKRLESP
jgi:tol-pal system protein YbgF